MGIERRKKGGYRGLDEDLCAFFNVSKIPEDWRVVNAVLFFKKEVERIQETITSEIHIWGRGMLGEDAL